MNAFAESPSRTLGAPQALPIPLTFGGVAAFAQKSGRWFLVVWLITSLLSAGTCLHFLQSRWIPVVESTLNILPENLLLSGGIMSALPNPATLERDNGFLSVVLAGSDESQGNMTADLQITVASDGLRLHSLLGYLTLPYPPDLELRLAPTNVNPWWNSRKTLFSAAFFVIVSVGLLLTWTALASVYYLPLTVALFFADRSVQMGKTWRLAGSLLIPGALMMSLAILLYTFHLLSLLGLLLTAILHIVIAWIYGIACVKYVPRHNPASPPTPNPFEPKPE